MIKRCRPLPRLCAPVFFVAAWLTWSTPAWAQAEPVSTKSWVGPYFLVVLLVALGLLIVLRSAGRKTDIRPKGEG